MAAKWQLSLRLLAVCAITVITIIASGLIIEDRMQITEASRFVDFAGKLSSGSMSLEPGPRPVLMRTQTPSELEFKGITYVSWTKGEYPFTTKWKPQTYPNSQAIWAVFVSTNMPHSGIGSLETTVDLVGGHPNKSNGEVFVDLRYHPPLCNPPDCVIAPVNFEGISITAQVFAPTGSRGDPQRPNGLQLFVKDEAWRSFYGSWHNIRDNQWNQISVIPGRSAPPLGYMDPGFDPTRIILLGVKLGAGGGSTATFSGTLWLDDVDWPGGQHPKYSFEHVRNPLDEIKGTNTNYVALINTWYMTYPTSTIIYSDAVKTHTDYEITRTIQEIHDRGMGILLKPHVDVQDGTWRGLIAPSDPTAWCNSYMQFITHFAEIAQTAGVEAFSVGTELESMSTSQHRSCWDTVIDAVRDVYTGTLTYAANWDGYKNVSFWDRVDLVGIDAYFPLSDARDPSIPELIAGWGGWLEQIENWQKTIGKPVIFTEIGYRNVDYCAKEPWAFDDGRPSNCQCQARAYAAALWALASRPWFRGMFWWAWSPWADAGGCCETTFTPQNKPAQQVLTCLYGTCRQYLPLIVKNYPVFGNRPDTCYSPNGSIAISCRIYSPDGQVFVIQQAGTNSQFGVFSVITNGLLITFTGELNNDLKGMAFSPNSAQVALLYHNDWPSPHENVYLVINLLTAPSKTVFGIPYQYWWNHYMVYLTNAYLAFSPDGSESNARVSSIDGITRCSLEEWRTGNGQCPMTATATPTPTSTNTPSSTPTNQ